MLHSRSPIVRRMIRTARTTAHLEVVFVLECDHEHVYEPMRMKPDHLRDLVSVLAQIDRGWSIAVPCDECSGVVSV